MRYNLEDKPGLPAFLLYGLQWWVVSLPCIIIMGAVAARLHFDDVGSQVFYMQKLFGLTGAAAVAQIYFGHRLPLVVGPAAILLVGVAASLSSGFEALYTSIMVGGLVLALTAACGLLGKIRAIFTPRVVSVILVLIAFTLTPTILKLVLGDADSPALNLSFTVTMVLAMIMLNQRLGGIWKSLTILFGLLGGCLVYFLLAGPPETAAYASEAAFKNVFLGKLDFQPGAVISFLFCMLALTVNELGSIEAIGHLLAAREMGGRVRRGVAVQGLANVAAGAMGVLGPVSYSLSSGIIAATGCASRHVLLPAGAGLAACAFFPEAVYVFSKIPGAVMGSLMLYLMTAQLASGLMLLTAEKAVSGFSGGITVGLPLMVGLMISFAPQTALAGFPEVLKPIVGNGFVMGAIVVMVLEHLVFRSKTVPAGS